MIEQILCPWPDWHLRESLGEGTCGRVWRAVNSTGQECAVKMIFVPPEPDWISSLRDQGLNDAQIERKLDDLTSDWSGEADKLMYLRGEEHIVRLEEYRVLSRPDLPVREIWLRMEKLKSLSSYLADKHLSEAEVIQIGLDLCDALSACHQHGFVHGDVKPENILVDDRGSAGAVFKLGDFGLSRDFHGISRLLPSHGTPAYMPPELAEGGEPDPRGDQYALGLTLYRLMNENRLPFLSRRPFASQEEKAMALRMRLSGLPLPAPCQASAQFAAIILQACNFDPSHRYPSMRHLRAALRTLQKRQQRANRTRTRRDLLALCAILLAGVLGFAGWYFLFRPPASPASPLVEARKLTREERIESHLRELDEILSKDDQYIIPVHLTRLSSLTALLEALPQPVWQGDALSVEGDDSGWNIWSRLENGKINSYVYSPADQLYHPQRRTETEGSARLYLNIGDGSSGDPTIELEYESGTLDLQTINLNFFAAPRNARIAMTMKVEEGQSIWTITYLSESRSALYAGYDPAGRLRSISLGRRTYSAEEALPVLENVIYLP